MRKVCRQHLFPQSTNRKNIFAYRREMNRDGSGRPERRWCVLGPRWQVGRADNDIARGFVMVKTSVDPADVMQQTRRLQIHALFQTQLMQIFQFIKNPQCESGDLMGMIFFIAAGFSQLQNGIDNIFFVG